MRVIDRRHSNIYASVHKDAFVRVCVRVCVCVCFCTCVCVFFSGSAFSVRYERIATSVADVKTKIWHHNN